MQYCDKRLRNFLIASTIVILVFSFVRISLVKSNVTLPSGTNPVYTVANNASTQTFSVAVLVIIGVFAAYALFATKKSCAVCASYDDSPTIFFAALIGFMGISTAGLYSYHYISNQLKASAIDIAVLSALILSSVYYFYTSSRAKKQGSGIYIALSFFPVIYSALRVMEVFIPARESAADSTILFRLFGLAFTMLFFVIELKTANGVVDRRATVFFGLTAVFLNLLFQIPDIALSAFWLLGFSMKSILTAIDLFISLYILARLFALVEMPEGQGAKKDINA